MKRLLLITLLFIAGGKLFAQTPTSYQIKFDTTDLIIENNPYKYSIGDKLLPLYYQRFVSPDITVFEHDLGSTIDITDSPNLSLEVLNNKYLTLKVQFELVDSNDNSMISEWMYLPVAKELEVYNFEFLSNDSVDLKIIEKVRIKRQRDYEVYNDNSVGSMDFYLSALGVGLELSESSIEIYDEQNYVFNVSEEVLNTNKSTVLDQTLILEDTINDVIGKNEFSSVAYYLAFDSIIDFYNRPFLSLRIKTNQRITAFIIVRDTTFGGFELETGLKDAYDDGHGASYMFDESDCYQIINVDVLPYYEHLFGEHSINVASGIELDFFGHDTTKSLKIEIQDVILGGVLEQDFPQVDILDIESLDLQYTGEVLVSSEVEANGKVFLSKNQFFGEKDTILLDFNITPEEDSYFFDKWIGIVDATGAFDDRFRIESPFRIARSYYIAETVFCGMKRYESFLVENQLTVGLDDKEKESLKLFPNPVLDQLTIENEGLEIQSVNIYDIRGSLMKQIEIKNELIDVSDLETGVYLLQMKTIDGLRQDRFMKE